MLNENITNFWNWFKDNKGEYENFNDKYRGDWDTVNKKLDALIGELQNFSEGLYVEIGGQEEPWELIITPQGRKEYFGDALAVVEHAPEINNWKFFGTKPAYGPNFNFKMNDIELNPNSITFVPIENEDAPDDIAIRVFHDHYTEEEGELRNAIIMGIYQSLDCLLGEVSVTFDINELGFAAKPQEGDKPLPLKELPGYIEWKKKERAIYDVQFPEEQITMLQGEYDGKPIMLLVNRMMKYYQFKKDFPYLLDVKLTYNATQDNGMPDEDMEPIHAIEDVLYNEVCTDGAGHYIASESHDGIRRIMYFAKSIDKLKDNIISLKSKINSHEVSYETAYDPFWVSADIYL